MDPQIKLVLVRLFKLFLLGVISAVDEHAAGLEATLLQTKADTFIEAAKIKNDDMLRRDLEGDRTKEG